MELANGSNSIAESPPDPDAGRGHCGWGCLRPSFLQRLATPKSFLFWIVWAGGFQSTRAHYNSLSISLCAMLE